jgi:hypothetical protein
MSTDSQLQQAIDLKQLNLPPELHVLSIEAEDGSQKGLGLYS